MRTDLPAPFPQAQTVVISTPDPSRLDIHVSSTDTLRGRFIRELVDSGQFAALTGSELAALIALTRWIDVDQVRPDCMLVSVSVGKLRAVTGRGRSIAHTSLKSLVKKGVIYQVVTGIGHLTAVYALPLSKTNDGPPPSTLRESTTGAALRARANGTLSAGGARSERAPVTLRARAINTQSATGADTSGGDTLSCSATAIAEAAACAELLVKMGGFSGEDAQQVAGHPNCNLRQVKVALERCDYAELHGKLKTTRQAYIADAIRRKYAAPLSAAQRREQANPEHVQEQRTIVREERAAIDAKERRVQAALEALPADELQALVKEVIEIVDPTLRKMLVKSKDPMTSPLLRGVLHGHALKRGLVKS